MRLTAQYYRQHDADLTAEVPAESFHGWSRHVVEVPTNESALVCMHFWNPGLDDRLPFGPDSPYVGWYRVVEYLPRAVRITREVMPPLLAAARSGGLPLIHVGTSDYADRYPGYAVAQQLAGESPKPPAGAPNTTAREAWQRDWPALTQGAHNMPDIEAGWRYVDIPAEMKPRDEEPLVVDAHQLNAVCREGGIWHLIYCGFAINWCLLMSPGGMLDMSRLGYTCSAVRDAVTAVENRETARHEIGKQIALWRVGLHFGYVFNSADLIAALRDGPA